MSLAINTDTVTGVLLADGWHDVANKSFDMDSYEFLWDGHLVHGGGQSGVCATGFAFTDEKGLKHAGPLTAIQAVTYR